MSRSLRLNHTSLKWKYFTSIGAFMLLLIVTVLTLHSRISATQAEHLVREAQRAKVQRGVGFLNDYVRTLRTALLESVNLPWSEVGLTLNDRRLEVRRLLKLFPALTQVQFVGTNGTVTGSASNFRFDVRPPRPDSPSTDGQGGGHNSLSEFSVDASRAGDPTATFSVHNTTVDSQAPGLVVTLNLSFLTAMLQDISVDGDSAFAVDRDGKIVAHSNLTTLLRSNSGVANNGTELLAWARRAAENSNQGDAFRGIGIEGSEVLALKGNLSPLPWTLVIERPVVLAYRSVAQLYTVYLALLGIGLVATFAVAFYLSRNMTAPILEMEHAVSLVGAGDLSARVSVNGTDEINRLAMGFNDMTNSLKAYSEEMETLVENRTSELSRIRDQLQVASQHKSDFLAHMSHELRTPLNAVIGFSEMLKAQYFGPLNDKQAEYVRDINASGQHLLSLINDILDLAKVEAGRMELVRSDVHLPSVVEACCSLVSERFARKSQTLEAVVDPAVSFWFLDERKVKQCVLNLLSNANKFTPNGGRVALQVSVEAEALVLRVTDTGVGIAPDAVSQLFTEFYQVAPSSAAAGGAVAAQSTDAREGTGLGLSLTKKFVELHGGTVEVASVVGKGSTFTLRFPVAANPDSTATAAS